VVKKESSAQFEKYLGLQVLLAIQDLEDCQDSKANLEELAI
jgi:hypothetical protein